MSDNYIIHHILLLNNFIQQFYPDNQNILHQSSIFSLQKVIYTIHCVKSNTFLAYYRLTHSGTYFLCKSMEVSLNGD